MFGPHYDNPETLDENYKILSRTTWSSDGETGIIWECHGSTAIGLFRSSLDAYHFINHHLNGFGDSNRPYGFRHEPKTEKDAQLILNFHSQARDPRNYGDIALAARKAFALATHSKELTNSLADKINLPRSEQAVQINIPLAYLDTAGLREIIDNEPENGVMVAQNNVKFDLLTQIEWSGIRTPSITWRRDNQVAIGTFEGREDAAGFIHGFMSDSIGRASGFLTVETDDSIYQRGFIRESCLHIDSMAGKIIIPDGQGWNSRIDVTIPLRYLDIDGLRERVEEPKRQARPQVATGAQKPAGPGES